MTDEQILQIKSNLHATRLGKNIEKYDFVDSTNNKAKQNCDMPDGTLFVSDIQTNGRGRRGKEWSSSTPDGLWMSLLLKPDIMPYDLSSLTLAVAVAIIRAIKNITQIQTFIKWPNDIILNSKKLCGILCEISAKSHRTDYAICGIGLNLNQPDFSDNLQSVATSLFIETGLKTDKNRMAAEILNCFEPIYFDYLKSGMKNIMEEYKKNCITLNNNVIITDKNETYNAKAVNIDKNGELIIYADGKMKTIYSGNVSVRGIMGYV